jgi:hypothetical protein
VTPDRNILDASGPSRGQCYVGLWHQTDMPGQADDVRS